MSLGCNKLLPLGRRGETIRHRIIFSLLRFVFLEPRIMFKNQSTTDNPRMDTFMVEVVIFSRCFFPFVYENLYGILLWI